MFSFLLNKPLCYSALLSLSLHQSQLTVINTYHSPSAPVPYFLFFWCSGWIQHSAQLPFQPVPWLSLAPASPGDRVSASPRALGQVPAWQFLCPHAPVPPHLAVQRGARAHTACRRGGWCETISAPCRGTWHTSSSSSPSVTCQEHKANLPRLGKQTPPTHSSQCKYC